MLRGVNKQIIEINDTGNMFFERALLFVKPQYLDVGDHRLASEANKFLESISMRPVPHSAISLRRSKKRKKRICAVIWAAGILTLAVLVFVLIKKCVG